MVTLTI